MEPDAPALGSRSGRGAACPPAPRAPSSPQGLSTQGPGGRSDAHVCRRRTAGGVCSRADPTSPCAGALRAPSGKEAKLTVWAPGPQPVLGPLSPSSGPFQSRQRRSTIPPQPFHVGLPQPRLHHGKESRGKLALMLMGLLPMGGGEPRVQPGSCVPAPRRGKGQPAGPQPGAFFSTPKGRSHRAGRLTLSVPTSKGPGKASAATARTPPPYPALFPLPCGGL